MGEGKRRREKQSALSARQKQIIQILAQMAPRPVTLAVISEKLGVSTRTVLREMPEVERWLSENDFRFSRKPGIGMVIEEGGESAELIRELLEVENIVPMYSRHERRRQILGELLFAREPVKAFVFTSRYHISEGTLYDDLDVLGGWLKEHQIEIVRRPGAGIFLEGPETAIRQAIADAVFEFVDVDKILELLSEDTPEKKKEDILAQNPLLGFWDVRMARTVCGLLTESEQQLGVKYMDNGFIGLVIRILLAISRVRERKLSERPAPQMKGKRLERELSAARNMAARIEKEFLLEIPEEELGYLAMYFSSARIWSSAFGAKDPLQNMNIRQAVMSMAAIAEQLTNLPFRSCTGMVDDLVEHIDAFVNRVSMNLHMENPQSDLVRQSYPEIYSAVETACEILRELIAPREIPEAEIGYIAMHFAAAAEQIQESEQKIAAVVVCPAGIGTSKVLSANLMRSFRNLEIRRVISAFDIDPVQLRSEGIDLIISTTRIQTEFPHLCVGMILQTQDKLMIQNQIEEINRQKIHRRTREGRKPLYGGEEVTLDFIRRASRIGGEIVELIGNFRLVSVQKAKSWNHLVELASGIFAGNGSGQRKIAAGIRRREEIGDTYFSDMGIYLFHCVTDAVEHSRFGYLRLASPFSGERGEVRGVVVMLVPQGTVAREYSGPVSALSALLVDNSRFLQALQEGDATAGIALAQEALVKYYKNETTKRIGVN